MPMFYAKEVPKTATHYVACADKDGCDLFMRRDPRNPKEWQGFFGIWSDVVTKRCVQDLPYWALNPAEQEAHNKKAENRFLGFEITECPRKFFEYIATYGQATMKVDPGAGDHTVASLVWTSPFPKPTDSDKKLDAAIDKVKQATDDLVKARDAKPRVRMSAGGNPLDCMEFKPTDSQRYIHTVVTASPDLKITVGTCPSPSASKVMTAKANGTPYRLFIDHGWTDASLIEHGYMVAPVTVRHGMPEAGTKPINQGRRPRAKSAIRERGICERTAKFQTDRNTQLLKEAKEARESKRQAEKYTQQVKLCHLNIGDLFMVPETNMNVWQRSRWCGKLLKVVTTVGDNPNYTSGQFGLYGCHQKLRAMDVDAHENFEMPHLSTLVWRC